MLLYANVLYETRRDVVERVVITGSHWNTKRSTGLCIFVQNPDHHFMNLWQIASTGKHRFIEKWR